MNPVNPSKNDAWKLFLKENQNAPFNSILQGFKTIFSEKDVPVVWTPDQYPLASNVSIWIKDLNLSYPEFYDWSIKNKAKFWEHIIKSIPLKIKTPYTAILKEAADPDQTKWLQDATFNIVESCFLAKSDQTAFYYQSEQSPDIIQITYGELQKKVRACAAALNAHGIAAGDRIVLYIPFSIEAITNYLALIYIGAEPVLVADSFSAIELKKRIDIIQATTVITTDFYWYADKKISVLPKVLEANPERIILHTAEIADAYSIRNNVNDILLTDLLNFNAAATEPFYHSSTDTISILFSSGTTKEPKALPWTATTPIKCAADGKLLQDIHEGDVVTWTSGMGWMMAPWLIFASLLNKASIAIYSGAYSKKEFIDFTIQTKVTVLGTIPSVVKSWRAQDFGKIPNWNVRVFSSTGEPSDMDDYLYLLYMNNFKAPIIEYCGGTEIGGGYISSAVVLPNALSCFNTAAPGSQFILINEHKEVLSAAGSGEVFIIPPAIGLSQQLLNKNHHEEYYSELPAIKNYPLLRKHGDGFTIQQLDGISYYKSIGRTDDSMNLGGIKISSIEIETVINKHAAVFESAAIASQDKNGGPEKLILFIHPLLSISDISAFQNELQKMIQKELNPLFKIFAICFKENFPRTASNKLMRKELRKEYLAHQ
ncbi:AMP-binding protein [Cytophaga aurantiaca]|uniref:AMP-binding protein n=1 Tax=Cytophaga aurantiaca TaxID=29530 RepID=UPI00038095C0|nr:AMP-binding protein [Cytophaga aurantiaca]